MRHHLSSGGRFGQWSKGVEALRRQSDDDSHSDTLSGFEGKPPPEYTIYPLFVSLYMTRRFLECDDPPCRERESERAKARGFADHVTLLTRANFTEHTSRHDLDVVVM